MTALTFLPAFAAYLVVGLVAGIAVFDTDDDLGWGDRIIGAAVLGLMIALWPVAVAIALVGRLVRKVRR